MRRALVTGATGLVGSYIVDRLLADGWTVRALVRDPSAAGWLEERGVELAKGDVLDAASITSAAHDRDAVFHTAAAVTPTGGWEAYRRPNIDGTRNVIAACRESGARLLHLSSVAVYGPSRYRGDGRPTDEATPLAPLPDDAWYARSKRESEQMVLRAHQEGAIWATAIRPCVIYGVRDRQFVPRAARLFSRGFAPSLRGGRAVLALVHAANVADAAVRAIDVETAGGKAYNTANDHAITVRDFVRYASSGLDREVRSIPVPMAVAAVGVTLLGLLLRLSGRSTGSFGPRQSVDFLSRDNPFDSSLARRELGWSPPMRPQQGVPEAFQWWRDAERGKYKGRT